MGCDNRCNSSLTCGITNTIIRNLIAENCGEGGIEVPNTSGCVATFVTAIEPPDFDAEYSVTFSFNGGASESYYDENIYYILDRMTLHPFSMNKAVFILNPDNLPADSPPGALTTLAGFTHDGFMAGDLSKQNILNESVIHFDNEYEGPFSFSPEVNTLEIFPSMDVRKDVYDFFGGASLGGAPIVVKSCNILNLGSRPIEV